MNESTSHLDRTTILLSINAAAILIVGVLITSAIWLNGGVTFRAVDERSDIVADSASTMELLESVSDSEATIDVDIINNDDYILGV